MSDVIDYVKENKTLYKPKKKPSVVDVPEMQFIMVDGKGAPDPDLGTGEDISEFQDAVKVLYGLVYGIKMSYKGDTQLAGYQNFKVPPLEALWWMADNSEFDVKNPDKWRWTAMIRVPDFVTESILETYALQLAAKKKTEIYKNARLEKFKEGLAVQVLHVGPYSAEGPTIELMHNYAGESGYKLHGKHHELYFSDPRRSAPENLKTVLRHPVASSK